MASRRALQLTSPSIPSPTAVELTVCALFFRRPWPSPALVEDPAVRIGPGAVRDLGRRVHLLHDQHFGLSFLKDWLAGGEWWASVSPGASSGPGAWKALSPLGIPQSAQQNPKAQILQRQNKIKHME